MPREQLSFEPGEMTQSAIIAMTRSRSRHGRDAINCSIPMLCSVVSTAFTFPCGRLRRMDIFSPMPLSGSF